LRSEKPRNVQKVLLIVIRPTQTRWVGHEALLEGNKNACSVLVIKSEGKMPLGRLRGFWEENTKMCTVLFQPAIYSYSIYFLF